MDVGTAKPSVEERRRIPHSMIDLVEPEEDYSVSDFQATARREIAESDRPVLVVGGSGLHMRAVIDPLEFLPTDPSLREDLSNVDPEILRAELLDADPEAAASVDVANGRRVVRAVEVFRLTGRTPSEIAAEPSRKAVAEYRPLLECRIFGIDPGDALDDRIDARLDRMLEAGLLEEVERLAPRLGRTSGQAVGYKELVPVVTGEASREEGLEAVRSATRALARRQRTWFRRDPRVEWLDPLRCDVVSTVMAEA